MIRTARSKSSWEESGQPPRPVKIEVTCVDQPGLLAAISSAITSADANIARAQVRTFSSQRAVNTFEVMIKNSEHLKEVLQNISKVKGVYKAVRGRGRAGSNSRVRWNGQGGVALKHAESLGDLLDASRVDAIGAHQRAFDLAAELAPHPFLGSVRHERLVLLLAWLTFIPTERPLPQIVQTLAI